MPSVILNIFDFINCTAIIQFILNFMEASYFSYKYSI